MPTHSKHKLKVTEFLSFNLAWTLIGRCASRVNAELTVILAEIARLGEKGEASRGENNGGQ